MLDEIGVQHQIWYYSLAHHAIEALTRKQFPLDCKLICIADILPDIDSKDVIRRIRMCPDLESTPVAIMSADPYIESEGEMTCKLKKPVQKVELSGLLQRFHLLQPQKKAV